MARPTLVTSSLLFNAPGRPVRSVRLAPRLVTNLLGRGNGASTWGHDRYRKDASSSWGDFPTDTSAITWGYNEDGGQWFQCATTQDVLQRVWASVSFAVVVGETYLISFTVDSKTGTHANNNAEIASGGPTFASGTTPINNPSPGRYVLGGRCTAAGTCVVRLGIGTSNNNNNTSTIRYSNVMVERVPAGRLYPSEYVRPGDQHVFSYSYTADVTSGLVGTPTIGATYEVPRRSSVLILGDSFANDPGDFPSWLRVALAPYPIATNGLGVAGAAIAAITNQIEAEIERRSTSPTCVPYGLCIAHGGVNDVNSNRTLAQMQADRLAQISAIEAAGMYPVLLTTSPLDASSAGQQTVMDAYNAWIKTLGYPVYDLFTDAEDGSDNFKTSWNSSDGVHPGTGINDGMNIMAKRLAQLIMLIPD